MPSSSDFEIVLGEMTDTERRQSLSKDSLHTRVKVFAKPDNKKQESVCYVLETELAKASAGQPLPEAIR